MVVSVLSFTAVSIPTVLKVVRLKKIMSLKVDYNLFISTVQPIEFY